MFKALETYQKKQEKLLDILDLAIEEELKKCCKKNRINFYSGMGTWFFTKDGETLYDERLVDLAGEDTFNMLKEYKYIIGYEFSCQDIKEG
jgi:hypothetical protein